MMMIMKSMATNPYSFFCRKRALEVVKKFFEGIFIDSIFNNMRCNKCNIDMDFIQPSSGGYYICGKCNDVGIPVDMGNTFHIDKEYELKTNR